MATVAAGSVKSTDTTALETKVSTIDQKLVNAVNSVVVYNGAYTINTTDWDGTLVNRYDALETAYPHAQGYACMIGPDASMTQAQLEAYQAAQFAGSASNNYILATGTKPAVALPVVLTVWQKQATTVTP